MAKYLLLWKKGVKSNTVMRLRLASLAFFYRNISDFIKIPFGNKKNVGKNDSHPISSIAEAKTMKHDDDKMALWLLPGKKALAGSEISC